MSGCLLLSTAMFDLSLRSAGLSKTQTARRCWMSPDQSKLWG